MASRIKKKAVPASVPRARGSLLEREPRLFLAALLLFALGIRIAALLDLGHTVYLDFMLWDEAVYHDLALRIANGTDASAEVYEFAPLFAYLMAAVYRLFSPDIYYIRLLNILFGVLSCWVIYGIGVKLGGRKIGLLACGAAALYKPFILYSIVPLKEAPTLLLFALTSWLLATAVARKDLLYPGLLGLSMGGLLNLRPNTVILIPLLLALILWYRYRDGDSLMRTAMHGGLYLLALAIALAPFVIRNVLVAGKFTVTTSQSGFNLYLGNNPANPDPYYRPVSFASSSPSEQGIQFTIEASRRAGRPLNATEASEYWTKETLRQARENPVRFAEKMVLKALALVNRFEACDHYDIGFLSGFVSVFKLPFLSFWFVFPLAGAAFALGIFRDRRARSLGLMVALYGSTLVIFFTNARYRLPMLAVLIPFAVMGGVEGFEAIRSRRLGRAALFAAAFAAFAAVAFLPVRATDDRTAYLNTHAIILDSRGFTNEAMLYWRQSSEMNRPFSAFANLSLAYKYFQRGLYPEANRHLDLIDDGSFAVASKYEIKGDMLLKQQRAPEAAEAYERSLAVNSGQRRILFKLRELYRQSDPQKAAEWEDRLKTIARFYPPLQKGAANP